VLFVVVVVVVVVVVDDDTGTVVCPFSESCAFWKKIF